MTEAEFRAELKALNGGYLFFGGEDYLKYTYSREVAKRVLDGSFDEFNHIILYGEEFSPPSLSQAIGSLPMMAEKKLVEVRCVDFNSMKKDTLNALCDVLSTLDQNEHTILIIRADNDFFNPGRLPKNPSEVYASLTKYIKPVELEFPSASRLKSWIVRHFQDNEVEFDGLLCDKLVEACGHDMWALSNEIDKLSAYIKESGKQKITAEDIENVVCKTIEYGDFQLTNALLAKNKKLTFETLYRQKASFESPHSILASVVRLYSELLLVERLNRQGKTSKQISEATGIHEYKLGKYLKCIYNENPRKFERAVELCSEADIKSKSQSNVSAYVAVERLISTLCALLCR